MLGLVLLFAGLGSVTIMPIAGAPAGRLGRRSVITLGYAGILAGPGAIGLIARDWSLPRALLVLAAALAAAAFGGFFFRFPSKGLSRP